MRARRLLGTVVARGEEERGAGKGTGRLGFRSPGSLKEAEQIDCSCLPNQVLYNVYKGIKQITGPSPSNLLRLATSGPPPSILHARHNSIVSHFFQSS